MFAIAFSEKDCECTVDEFIQKATDNFNNELKKTINKTPFKGTFHIFYTGINSYDNKSTD